MRSTIDIRFARSPEWCSTTRRGLSLTEQTELDWWESERFVAKRPDRRVQRTQRLLREALVALIQEKGFEALTVQDIIDRANVGRATFYAHFDNKEDLLVSGFDELRAALRERQTEALSRESGADERMLAFSHHIIVHVSDYRQVFRAMVGKRSGAMVQQLMYKMLVDLVRDDMKTAVRRDTDSIPIEAFAHFIAGALFGLLMWWLGGKTRLSVEDLNAFFRRIAIPAMKAASI